MRHPVLTRARPLVGALFLVATALGGCERVVATARQPAPGAEARWGEAPFPSDLFLAPGAARIGAVPGLEALAPRTTAPLRAQLATLDGFGTRPVIELPFDGLVDAASIPARTASIDAPVFLVRVDDAAVVPVDWRVVEGAGLTAGTSRIVGALARGAVLEEGTLYAAVVTTQARGVSGALAPGAGLAALRGAAPEALPPEARSTRRALDALGALGHGDVVSLGAFTTGTPTRALVAARALLDELPAPVVTFDDPALLFVGDERLRELLGEPQRDEDGEARLGWSFGTGLAHDHVAAVGTGTLRGVTFRRPERGDNEDPASGTWAIGPDGAPVVDREVALPVSVAVPKGDMPAGGWPVAFFGHGLGGSRAQMLAFIDTLAREGWATVAIDADGHGQRHTDVDERNNAGARIGPDFRGAADERDGFGDVEGNAAALALFHDFVNIAAMRDQMRQSVVDLSQVVRAIQGGVDLGPLGGGTLDATRVAYLGESFGGVLGSLFSSVEPDVRLYYLDVPGGGILEYVATNSPAISGFASLFVPATYGLDPALPLDRFHPLLGLGSAIFDGADPLTYAPHTLRARRSIGGRALGARHIVIGCVIGDEVLPNSATHALARAYGLPLLGPSVLAPEGIEVVTGPLAGNLDGQTAALVHFAPASHGDNWSSERGVRRFLPFSEDDIEFAALDEAIAVVNPVRATHDQVRRLLRDHAAGRTPTLELTVVPYNDFDGDGVHDEDDATPFGE